MLKTWNEMVQFEYAKNKLRYYVYLILIDGAIHDIDETVDYIVESSSLPVSIIIVGVGNADFSAMNFLDADEERLFSTKHQKFQERDNVQFVEFRKYKNSPHMLARETLQELPQQMIDYYKKRNITPGDLKTTFVDREARDYFSHKAMEYIEKVSQMNYDQEALSKVVNEGVPFIEN